MRAISPLEGEMSPKATEGVAGHKALASSVQSRRSHPVEPTPSGLPAISPSRREIGSVTARQNARLQPKLN
ncbi:MAG: hypothetical protein E5Y06_08920 [Mesorhizobium sp.]|nr:MAG: hypothetical protein E5Y06_08920 [Mesorhizobium sp.]TJU98166.1 MAG: hypothetical protein E5Y08_14750 [Mesorhizobium sp.]TJV15959.1 MAG: hypothetical protein E5Y07_20045 [Mesorhizobium sp.]